VGKERREEREREGEQRDEKNIQYDRIFRTYI